MARTSTAPRGDKKGSLLSNEMPLLRRSLDECRQKEEATPKLPPGHDQTADEII